MSNREAQLIIAYCKHNMNAKETADEFFYTFSTIDYHLKKIRKKTGLNPKNFFDLVELYQMAVATLEGSNG